MMKNNSGVTLISLIITIITFLIIIAITIDYGVSTLHDATNDKFEAELSLVQEAVIQKYSLMKTLKKDGKIASRISSNTAFESDSQRPEELIGTRIASTQTLTANDFTTFLMDYSNPDTMTYEQYYYLLEQTDLEKLGIEKSDTAPTEASEKSERSYIVNYYTGEVFDIANKKYYKTDTNPTQNSIYLPGTTHSDGDEINYNFSDD